MKTDAALFWKNVEKTPFCWLWKGRVQKRAGAMFSVSNIEMKAARVALMYSGISIPDKSRLQHRCKNKLCVNPEHIVFAAQVGPSSLTRQQASPRNVAETASSWFWERVAKKDDGCWFWLGAVDINGYGNVQFNGSLKKAHRVSYTLKHGEVPSGLCVLHHCDNPPCVNPEHLWAGTKKENTKDMLKKGRDGHASHPGVDNGRAKLTEAQVLEIRKRFDQEDCTFRKLASEFLVSPVMIKFIVRRDNWKHI